MSFFRVGVDGLIVAVFFLKNSSYLWLGLFSFTY